MTRCEFAAAGNLCVKLPERRLLLPRQQSESAVPHKGPVDSRLQWSTPRREAGGFVRPPPG